MKGRIKRYAESSTISLGHKISLVMSTACYSALNCSGSQDNFIRWTPSGIRVHDGVWLSSIIGISPYQLRAGGAYVYQQGANHSISSGDVSLQRPVL